MIGHQMQNFHSSNAQTYEYAQPRTSPLVKLLVFTGAVVLIIISGVLAFDVFRPDDSGFAAPVASLVRPQNNTVQTASMAPDTKSNHVIGQSRDKSEPFFQPRSSKPLQISSLEPSAPIKNDDTEPQVAEKLNLGLINDDDQEAIQIADTPVKSDKIYVSAKQVERFAKEWNGSEQKTQMQKYIRTTSVLKQCGFIYIRSLKVYEGENKPKYDRISAQREQQLQKNKNGGRKTAQIGAINPEDFQLSMTQGTANRHLTTIKRSLDTQKDIVDDPYPGDIDGEACKAFNGQVKAGALNLTDF